MITDIPHKLWLYLGTKNTSAVPAGIDRKYYLSWEDALWDLLRAKKIPKGALCLVPEFFCWDVVKNMMRHGLQIKYYPVDKCLQTSSKQFVSNITKLQPQIVIIFHAVGIKNELINNKKCIDSLALNTILIEDSVHALINPSEIRLIRNNHFIIDSWRKVLPLQGSAIYGKNDDMSYKQSKAHLSVFYQLKVTILWLLMELFSIFKLDRKAQTLMQYGYDVIGDNLVSAPLFPLFSFLHKYINYKKIRTIKYNNMRLYDNFFKTYELDENIFFPIKFIKKNWSDMRGYPLGLEVKYADGILKKLRDKELLVRFELNDCPWSKKQKVIYLPNNLEIDVEKIIKPIVPL